MDIQTSEAIVSGVYSVTDIFYTLGAAILIVQAAQWGFRQVKKMLESDTYDSSASDEIRSYKNGGSYQDYQDRYVDVMTQRRTRQEYGRDSYPYRGKGKQ